MSFSTSPLGGAPAQFQSAPSPSTPKSHNVVPFPVPLFSGEKHEVVHDFLVSAEFAFKQRQNDSQFAHTQTDLHSLIIRTHLRGRAQKFARNLPEATLNDPRLLKQALTKRFSMLTPWNTPQRMKSFDGLTHLRQRDKESLNRYLERVVEMSDQIDPKWDSELAERFVAGIRDKSVWVLVCSIIAGDATIKKGEGFSFQTAVEAVRFAIRALFYRKQQHRGNEDLGVGGESEFLTGSDDENLDSDSHEGRNSKVFPQRGSTKKKTMDCNTPIVDSSESGCSVIMKS